MRQSLRRPNSPDPLSGPLALVGERGRTHKLPGCGGRTYILVCGTGPVWTCFCKGSPSGAALCGASLLEGMLLCPVLDVLGVHTASCCVISVSHLAFSRKLVSLRWESNAQLLIGCESVFFFFFFQCEFDVYGLCGKFQFQNICILPSVKNKSRC